MQNTEFTSPFTATWNGKDYDVVFLIDYVQGIVSFQDKPYHPSEIHTRPLVEVTLTPIVSEEFKQAIISADAQAKALASVQVDAPINP